MDNIYIKSDKKIPIQQGVIINGCIAENYDFDTYGLIITPRCDIGNGGKVSTIHYLPIVPLEKWIIVDCLQNSIRKFRNKLSKKLEKNEISSTLLEYLVNIDDFKTIVKEKPNKQNLIEEYSSFYKIIIDKNYDCKELLNYCNNEYSDLYSFRHNRFYLIKNWNNPNKYNVILLRDIKRISLDLISQFPNGCQNKNFDEKVYLLNDIYKSDSVYYFKTITQISSPYIEYVIQQFSHNFCRIGVDHPINKDDIKSNYELEKIIKI